MQKTNINNMITVKQYKEILDVASNFIVAKNEGVSKDYHSGFMDVINAIRVLIDYEQDE